MEIEYKPLNTFVFICSISEISAVLQYKKSAPDDIYFIAISREIADSIKRAGHDCILLFDFISTDVENELRKKVLFWIDQWSEKAVGQNKSIKSLLEYKDFSLWWFALPILFPDIERCVQYVEALECMLDTTEVEKVAYIVPSSNTDFPLRLNRDRDLPNKIIDLVCRQRGMQIDKIRGSWNSRLSTYAYSQKIKLFYKGYYRIGIHVTSLLRRLILNFGKHSNEASNRPTVLALSSMLYWREALDEHGRMVFTDSVASSSLVELKQRGYRVIGIDVELNTPSWKRLLGLIQKRKDPSVLWTAMEDLIARVPVGNTRAYKSRLEAMYDRWKNAGLFEKNIMYGRIDIAPLLSGRNKFLFEHYFGIAISYLEALEVSLKRWNPKLMIIVYEEGPHGRAAVLVGQEKHVPTLALQHGTLAGAHVPAYFFTAVRHENRMENPLACPIPTQTAVYGEKTKNMLTRVSAYPKDDVKVVGMPSQDSALRFLRKTGFSEPYEIVKVPQGNPIILVISQPFITREYKDYFVACVIEAAIKCRKVEWVVKLHPSESGTEWEQYLKQKKNEGLLSLVEGNLQPWLLVCTVLVAWYSTTILEAALFKKRVIAIKIPGCANADEYIADGIANGVSNVEELLAALKRVFEPDIDMVHHSENKLDQYISQQDRYASERVADLSETMMGYSEDDEK